MSIGLRIKEIREEKNIKQSSVASGLGVSVRQIQRWEKEETYPPVDVFMKMADFFNVSMTFLSGGEEVESEGANTKVLSQLNEIKKILLEEVGHNHETIVALVKSRAEEVGVDLMRELKQSKDAIKSLLDLQDKVSDERLAAARIGEVGHTAVELMNDISGLDGEILEFDKAIAACFS